MNQTFTTDLSNMASDGATKLAKNVLCLQSAEAK